MTSKQIPGSIIAPDGSEYVTLTDGGGNLVNISAGSGLTGAYTAGDLLIANSSGLIVDPSAIAAVFPASGVIATLGAITGGSSYTTGTQILTLGAITAGSLYVDGTYTAVPLTGGTGSGAQATIIVLNGGVVQVTITNVGTGYVAADSLSASNANLGGAGSGFAIPVSTVGYTNVALTGGAGSGATATIRVAAGAVVAVTITNRGTGYAANDSLSASAASIGGTGSGFSVLVSTVGGTSIAGNGGTFYTNTISGVAAVAATGLFNNYTYNADTVDARAPSNGATAWNWNLNMGGGYGHRTVGQFTLNLTSSPLDFPHDYVAFGTLAQANSNAGGTSGAGNGKSNLFGSNPYCRLISGATFWSQCVGEEIDVSVRYGASVDQIIGLQVVQDALSKVPANQYSASISSNNASGALGWDYLITDGSYSGFPSLKTTGSIFRAFPHANSGNCGTIGSAFDLNDYATITNFVLRGPQANGNIDGSFNITAPRIAVTGSSAPTNGLYLSAANTTSVAANSTLIASFVNTNNGFLGLNVSTPINSGEDMISLNGGNSGGRAITIKNSSSSTSAQATLYLANNSANKQAAISLNGGGFSGGQGANALQISNTSTAPIVIGTGTEVIKFGTSGAFTVNGSVATVLTSLGPVGSHTTVQKWLTITDSGGTVGYIPVF